MLVYVPQGYVALVYQDGRLRAVLEAGVGAVASEARVEYVDLQLEAQAAATLQ